MAKNINIGGRLHSIATGNVIAGADEILDDNLGKKQTQINTETYSLVESVNNALAELNPDQQEALGVAAKANANEAKLGYYVCDTDAAVAAKTIAATGYVLGTGGNIRIKMTNANTVNNATLNINSTGAKALFYNGTQASSTNSWEAGEVIEVYYDGERYQCGGRIVDDEPTAGSNNLVKSGGVYSSTPTVANSFTESDLDISDEQGNVLARIANGHIQVKNFSSVDVLDSIQAILSNIGFDNVPEFSEEADYAIGDIVRYGKYIYVFISAHTTGEWDETEVEKTVINAETEHPIEVHEKSETDLDFSDEQGHVVMRIADGHIITKNFDSKNIQPSPSPTPTPASKQKISYLAIGNSVNQDPACYIPYLLKKLYGDDIDFEIGIAYHGSYTIKDYVELMITGQGNLETFSYAKNTGHLTNISNVPLSYAVGYADWDIISFETYQTDMAGSGRTEDVTLAPDLLDWLKQHTKDGCRFGLITPATYTDVRNLYVGWQQDILTSCSLDFLLDYGATKEFLIAKGFINSDLSPLENGRYIHSKEGFPCEALALTAIHFLADIVKIDDRASNLLVQITEAEHNALDVPQQNGTYTSTTEENWRKCVDAALNGWRVSLASYAVANNTLRNNTFTNI